VASLSDLIAKIDDEDFKVPKDLQRWVATLLERHPEIPWHRAIRLIIDPDAPPDNDDDEDDEGDDEGDDDEEAA
jgi:hypothetical protein